MFRDPSAKMINFYFTPPSTGIQSQPSVTDPDHKLLGGWTAFDPTTVQRRIGSRVQLVLLMSLL